MNNPAIRNSRLNKELTDLDRDPPPGISCYPKEDDFTDLEAYIKGPPDSPYEHGQFKLDIQIPTGYPFEPPQIRFVTSIYHPNIDDAGRICADILKKGEKGSWKPALNLSTTLILLSQLLAHPNPDDPLDADIANEYQLNYPTFRQKAIEYTKKYAVEEATEALFNVETERKQVDKMINDTAEKCQSNREEQEEENEEKMEESRKPKLSLSLTKKTNSTSSQSSLLSSSLSIKSKRPVLSIDPPSNFSSTNTEEKPSLVNTQTVSDLTTVKVLDHKTDLIEDNTKELVVASKEDLAGKKECQDLDNIKQDTITESAKVLVVDAKEDVIMGNHEDNIKNLGEGFVMGNKKEESVVDCNKIGDLEDDIGMQIQTVKVILRKSIKNRSREHINSQSTVIKTIEKCIDSESTIDTKPSIENDSSSQSTKVESKSETSPSSPSIVHTEVISPEDVELSAVNTQYDTQNDVKRKFVVLDEKPDVIDISDDDNDGDLIHTLQLSKKLKRNKISLSKQKR